MKTNRGYFFGNTYNKQVRFSKAVLWKDKQLSVPMDIWKRCLRECDFMIFKDPTKKEIWTFAVKQCELMGGAKRVGQEEQWYFPIEFAKKTGYDEIAL